MKPKRADWNQRLTQQFLHMWPHYMATLRLGIPLIVGQVGQVVLTFIDSAMIGHHATIELSAASFCINLFNLPIFFALGYANALTPLIGQEHACRKFATAGAILRQGLRNNIILGLLLTALMGIIYFALPSLGLPQELLPHIKPYYVTQLVSLLFITSFNALKQFTDALGKTAIAMWVMLGGNVLNIVGNYALIYGEMGFPELGLLGAGLSTLISRIAIPIALVVYLSAQTNLQRYKAGFFRRKLSPTLARQANSMGLFIGGQMALENGLFSLSIVMVGWLGSLQLAAHHVAVTVQSIGFLVYYGAAAAIAIRASHYHGMGQYRNVRRAAIGGWHVVNFFAAIIMLILLVLRHSIVTLFTNSNEVAVLAATLLLVGILYQPFDALQISFANALRGVGQAKALMWISLVGYFGIALPAAYLLGIKSPLGAVGIWLAFPIGLGLAGIGFATRFFKVTQLKRPSKAI